MIVAAGSGTTGQIEDSARSIADNLVSAVPRVGVALLIILVGWGLSRLTRWLLHRTLRRRQTPSFARVMSRLAGWLVLALSALLAVAVTFPSVKPVDLLAGLGFFSVAVGFAFQDILENTLAGVLLLFRQPFRSGDQIEVKEQTGTVEAITIRDTRIKTFDGQLVLVPNRDVYKSVIRVQTHFELRRLAFMVGIAYENDPVDARDVIIGALHGLDGIAGEPRPEAMVTRLSSSTVDIEVRFWTSPHQLAARNALAQVIVAVKSALDAAEIELPADIVVLQAAPSFQGAIQGHAALTPGARSSRHPVDQRTTHAGTLERRWTFYWSSPASCCSRCSCRASHIAPCSRPPRFSWSVGSVLGNGSLGVIDVHADDEIVWVLAELALFSVLFSDGMRVGLPELHGAWRLPGRALVIGLPLTLIITAVFAHVVAGLPWLESFLLGAVLSPTDPVFAAAIVGREEIPYRLRNLLNVESGLNDGFTLPSSSSCLRRPALPPSAAGLWARRWWGE